MILKLSNIDRIESEWNLKAEQHKIMFIRFVGMKKTKVSSLRFLQVFRLSCGQPARKLSC